MKLLKPISVVAAVALVAALAIAGSMEKFDFSEKLDGAKVAEVQIELSLAETHLSAGESGDLIKFEGSYDSRDMKEPTLKVERDGNAAYVYLESETDHEIFGDKHKDTEGGDFTISLSPEPEYSIRGEVGLGDNHFDFTGLKIKRLDLEAGLAELDIVLDKPNPISSGRVTLECGLGELNSTNLGYLRFEKLSVDVGMGDMTLDLGGYEGKGRVEVNVGMGSCEVLVPSEIGLLVYSDGGFMASVDLDNLKEVRDGEYRSANYDTATHTLELDLSVGMGDIDVRHR